ncbi:MAG: hypothetical protein IRY99_06865 [Isosphaeraceae bacterium]|nr:hypothetical protein [Isosphaeraceae bacterium]
MWTHPHPKSIAAATVAALFLLVFHAAGCGSGDNLPREPVSGSVTLDGKPLKSGLITFVPTGPDIPTQGAAAIVEGEYSIPRAQGLVPGKYKVVVSSGGGTPEQKVDTVADMPGMPPVPAKEAIPPQYNANSILEANVTAGGKNEFDFSLTSSPGGK